MSILNRPSDGIHSVLVVIYKYLLHKKRSSRDEIIAVCAPESLVNNQEKVRHTLNTWRDLGLFVELDGKFSLAADLPPVAKNPDTGMTVLRRFAREIVLHQRNNKNFWESEGSLSADFTRCVAWVLAQDVNSMPGGAFSDVEATEKNQFQDESKRIFQNDTRWSGFKAWAPFLGFGWIGGKGRSELFFTDPTVAVRDSLPIVFEENNELPAAVFLQILAKALPVVDGGFYRREVEAQLSQKHWQAPKQNEVSTSLSRALRRLHLEAFINLDDRADADKVTLLSRGRLWEFSHVIYLMED